MLIASCCKLLVTVQTYLCVLTLLKHNTYRYWYTHILVLTIYYTYLQMSLLKFPHPSTGTPDKTSLLAQKWHELEQKLNRPKSGGVNVSKSTSAAGKKSSKSTAAKQKPKKKGGQPSSVTRSKSKVAFEDAPTELIEGGDDDDDDDATDYEDSGQVRNTRKPSSATAVTSGRIIRRNVATGQLEISDQYLRVMKGVKTTPNQKEIDDIRKVDVPPVFLRQYANVDLNTKIQELLRQNSTLSETTSVAALNNWKDYCEARTYYECFFAQFILLLSMVPDMGKLIPPPIADALQRSAETQSSNLLTLRVMQDLSAVAVTQLQEAKKIDENTQYFIDKSTGSFKSHDMFMTDGLKQFFSNSIAFDDKKARLWKYRSLYDIKEDDFKKTDTELYPEETAAATTSATMLTPQPATVADQKERVKPNLYAIRQYHKFIKNLYKQVYLARKRLALHVRGTNIPLTLNRTFQEDIETKLDAVDLPIVIYEDLIIANFYDLQLTQRIAFSTRSFVKDAQAFFKFKLPLNAAPMMDSVLFKFIFDWKDY
jgi:hypothetical protein